MKKINNKTEVLFFSKYQKVVIKINHVVKVALYNMSLIYENSTGFSWLSTLFQKDMQLNTTFLKIL